MPRMGSLRAGAAVLAALALGASALDVGAAPGGEDHSALPAAAAPEARNGPVVSLRSAGGRAAAAPPPPSPPAGAAASPPAPQQPQPQLESPPAGEAAASPPAPQQPQPQRESPPAGEVPAPPTEERAAAPRPLLRGQAAEVTTEDVEGSLVAELAGSASSERLRELEAALRPTYDALPKEESGYLGHQAVRYALHRLLLQRHGWFIVGLEPTDEAPPPYLHSDWVPEYLQGLLERRLGDRGLDLREAAALAASLEDLVRAEAGRRLGLVLERLRVPADARVTSDEATRALEMYMMMYLDGGNFTAAQDLDFELAAFKAQYADWASASSWMQHIKGQHAGSTSDGKLGRAEMVSIANDLGERFGAFNDGECRSLKRELVGLEGPRPGRIPLRAFYEKGLYSHWQFNEKADYLRALGALDESDALRPSVIVPNYLGSRPNCLTASSLYAVCCRNECEDLMGHLERKIAAPSAGPQEILALVSGLPSDTVNASRQLPDSLARRLEGIAQRHGGQVPLHGRLFAQWMHHAYPRECPYPHEGGANPQTPDEWLGEAGGEPKARASEAEVRELLGAAGPADDGARPSTAAREEGAAMRGAAAAAPGAAATGGAAGDHEELPWTDAEVLLARGPAAQAAGPDPWELPVKAFLLLVLAALMTVHKGARPRDRKRMARNLDFADFDDLEDDRQGGRRQLWTVLLALAAVCVTLEVSGSLDRFSLCCTLLGGLLLNLALPLLLRRASKPRKCCE